MTTTSQADDPKDPTGSSSADPSVESKEPKTVPLGEHIELRQKNREALERIAKLEAVLAQSEKTKGEAAPKTPPVSEDLVKTIHDLKRNEQVRQLQSELGLRNPKQAAAVVELMGKNQDMTPDEALAIAAMRSPEDFKDRGARDGAEASFGSLAPRPGSQPQSSQPESDWKQRLAYANDLRKTDKRAHNAVFENAVGSHMAKAMGWDHQKIPLPKQ